MTESVGPEKRELVRRLAVGLVAIRRQRLNAKPPPNNRSKETALGCGVLFVLLVVIAAIFALCIGGDRPQGQPDPTTGPATLDPTSPPIQTFDFGTCDAGALARDIDDEVEQRGYSPFVIVGEVGLIPIGSSTDTRIQFNILHDEKLYTVSGTVLRWRSDDPECWYAPGSILPTQ